MEQKQKNGKIAYLLMLIIGGIAIAGIITSISLYVKWKNVEQQHVSSQNTTTLSTNQVANTVDYFDTARFDIDRVKDTVERTFISYGKKLIENTAQYIGPEVKISTMRFSGNNLNCSNCHLAAGTRPYSAPFIGVWGTYPNFRKRENSLGTLQDRINGCMARSMNGKPLPANSREMKAIKAYIHFLNDKVPIGKKIEGQGFAKMHFPDRAARPDSGKVVFEQHCVSCHGVDGQGLKLGKKGEARGYLYPPLWGPDSFNDGAGMHRLLTAARFIKANMPYGTPVGEPVLSDAEAYDVAAYINTFPRPEKAGKEKDYPNLKLKPQDSPYPPFADNWSAKRHRFGPYNFH